MTLRRLRHFIAGITARPLHTLMLILCFSLSVIAASTVQGLTAGISAQLARLISDWRNQRLIAAWGKQYTDSGGRICERNSITHADLDSLRATFTGRATFYPRQMASAAVDAAGSHRQLDVRAVGEDYFRLSQWYTDAGIPLTKEDDEAVARVCVVGATLARDFFGETRAAVGTTLRINGVPLRIKGVLERRGRSVTGEDYDEAIFVPVSTIERRLACIEGLRGIGYTIDDAGNDTALTQSMASLLRERHHLPPGTKDDFHIVDPSSLKEMYVGAFQTKERLVALITAIAAVIGIATVANVVLLSVRQRRFEIGLRRAVGATRRDIVVQITLEVLLIALCAAAVGILVYAAAAWLLPRLLRLPSFSSFPLVFSPATVLTAAGTAVLIGFLASVVPARAAARVNPTDALRP
jgi:putative ABC transport system permease protein